MTGAAIEVPLEPPPVDDELTVTGCGEDAGALVAEFGAVVAARQGPSAATRPTSRMRVIASQFTVFALESTIVNLFHCELSYFVISWVMESGNAEVT